MRVDADFLKLLQKLILIALMLYAPDNIVVFTLQQQQQPSILFLSKLG
jgi:hypothetical protein